MTSYLHVTEVMVPGAEVVQGCGMPFLPPPKWSYSNRHNAAAPCDHCEGIHRHEAWCITGNPQVQYAYRAVVDATKLRETDHLILHALGVCWPGR